MHICFVEIGYPRPSGRIGGAGTYINKFAKELVKLSHKVTVICGKMENDVLSFKDGDIIVYPIISPNGMSYYMGKIPYFRVFANSMNYLINGFKIYLLLNKLNSKDKIDLIEYSEGGDFWNSITKKFRYFSHLHGSSFTFKNNSNQQINKSDLLQRKLEQYFIKNAEKVISPCVAMVKIVETEMMKKLNAFIIPYPIDEKYFDKIINNDHRPSKSMVSILFASRNDPVKGCDLFIDSLEKIINRLKSVIEVDIFGYIPIKDVSHLEFLHVNRFVPKSELNLAYKKADICVIPSLFDNSPNTVYEAMASGKIVVASAVGGIPEIMGKSENGYLFTKSDVDDLTLKLSQAIDLVLSGNDTVIRKNAQERIISIANLQENVLQRVKLL
jgi:glycosyltransferase involved in cell wall biosynthesis